MSIERVPIGDGDCDVPGEHDVRADASIDRSALEERCGNRIAGGVGLPTCFEDDGGGPR